MLFTRRHQPSKRERVRTALWPRRSFARSFRYYRGRVVRLKASPHAIAAGVAAGAFASCTPLVGFHFILAFVLAWLVGGSLIAAAFGTAVGNPITFPFIWLTSFQIGSRVLNWFGMEQVGAAAPVPEELSFELLTSSFSTLWPTIQTMLLGGALLGLPVATVLYFGTRSAVRFTRDVRAARLAAARSGSKDVA
ncbi:MAG: DUF2062 domain-containing protein [Pseudomonadota bacterium]